jgi:hypothetical protein
MQGIQKASSQREEVHQVATKLPGELGIEYLLGMSG